MKKFITALFVMAIAFAVISTPVMAKDTVVTSKITSAKISTDKYGNEYVRFIIKEDREIQGIKYKADVVVMAFGSAVESAKNLKTGDTLTAVCSEKMYNGNKNYQIQTVLAQQ